ncbi:MULTISPECIES: sensor domain-containing diguanylate cyclase [unclassified Shewanella]|uniref:GGDEF domain-containing protein n=1 Tax=unclassified Shewanella TaxID=196818 RepID=UPI000C836B3E|nr:MULTISPECIES: sensor domain-containing diguanylate cyclase [unclassified Shewanella]MDO6620256.1 sensor domain-containing diguanylate cyclase [Shewanella sp. 6_MG-2023]MDO6638567.1 sensor domain-containing diguanylate cyclase [Shewanella sp. 5_MG-2023]MDO6679534.1 sensor domain-containing diguanylate cyclase [Shewanella sp. 4_MG-2023]MDO6774616.1 sensor domain-containing diguanylate cyclase [Shewanella sp. 3_MG-2023]PMG32272.1 diguanylate cyclase [Shewanella sp. 10N.286.52.C2]
MATDQSAMNELHWLIDMVQTIEVGLVVLDRDYNIQLWNGFMENHSGVSPNSIKGRNLFEAFNDLPSEWLKQKMESVFLLKNRSFISWEQRPYVFQFKNYRPITGRADYMYQNITLLPLASLTGEITHISIIVYDVTDIAINKLQLKSVNEQLETLSQTDSLTQLYNRRHWQVCFEKEYERFARYGEKASMIMIDIDHFKAINDKYGHPAGDKVIQSLANILKQSLRETDFAGRYGGEEFAVVLTYTTAAESKYFTERLRKKVEASQVVYNNQIIKMTISIGVNDLSSATTSSVSWLSGADKALYQSKENGRNQTTVFEK